MSFTNTKFQEDPLLVSEIYQIKEKQKSQSYQKETRGLALCRVAWKLAHINQGVSIPKEIPRGPRQNKMYHNLMGKTVKVNIMRFIQQQREINTSC